MLAIIVGHIGSDAGYWYFGADGKLHHVGGWQAEEVADLRNAVNALQDAVQIREPGVAEAVAQAVIPLVERALSKNVQAESERGIIIVGGAAREATAQV